MLVVGAGWWPDAPVLSASSEDRAAFGPAARGARPALPDAVAHDGRWRRCPRTLLLDIAFLTTGLRIITPRRLAAHSYAR